jgi:DNA replication protein DnaC
MPSSLGGRGEFHAIFDKLDKAVIRQLATCRRVEEHYNVILVGATGVGKSFIACALAHQACRTGYRAGYRRASRLFHEPTLARADGTYIRLLTKLARLDVLVIDDWALAPAQDQERRDLLEILEDRYGTRSTIISSQLPPAQWHSDRAGCRDYESLPEPPDRPDANESGCSRLD